MQILKNSSSSSLQLMLQLLQLTGEVPLNAVQVSPLSLSPEDGRI